jgi:hypothetical protein
VRRLAAALAAAALLFGATNRPAAQPPDTPVFQEPPPDLLPHLIENGVESLEVTPGPVTFKDPFSGGHFPTTVVVSPVGGPQHRLRALGSGGRKKLFWKIYGAAFYADETAYLGTDPLKTLVNEDLARRIVFYFRRNASEEQLTEAFKDGMSRIWKAEPPPDVAPDVAQLLSYFEGGLRKEGRIEFTYLPGKGLYTTVGGIPKPVIANPEVARRIWAVWLGEDPVSPSLRKDLIRFLSDEKKAILIKTPEETGE